jgi:ABC-type polar amino acid transport system ATPase subunit
MMIEVNNLICRFGDITALDSLSLNVDKGQVVAVIGPSGSGKSTLLRCLNALERFQSGEVIIGGTKVDKSFKNIHKIRLEVGMVFQQFNLFPHLNVINNMILAQVVVRRRNRNNAREKSEKLLELVGLSDKINAFPAQLSGGQKQRVAIARALAMNPMVMLFDEVTSALDPEMVGEVLDVMRRLASEGMTMILATHEINFARELADKIIFIDNGKIIEEGPPEIVIDNPVQSRTREFLRNI